ncbi:hypothetical protein GPECTOR_18g35 [Gonium pectorale]|uniref:Uncharacterized protein n=1 Tax=Gonium pectorale TaxID=33097 RepID=A0A150GK23_GONPE|nr:hypothetical protein GPECTOR_18g35 [Gonium pectorale]|eukprot:KXZ50055.1 hypothetical protein GPECTOR_18g35 [Gonium pectorale]
MTIKTTSHFRVQPPAPAPSALLPAAVLTAAVKSPASPTPSTPSDTDDEDAVNTIVRAEMALSVFPGLDRPAAAELGAACAALGLSLSDARRLLARPHGERLLFAALRRAPGLGDPAAARIVRCCYESMWRGVIWEGVVGAALALAVGLGAYGLAGRVRDACRLALERAEKLEEIANDAVRTAAR